MIRLTLSQMRTGARRLAAAGIAVVAATAFVAATLLAGVLAKDTTYRTVTASLAEASVVVRGTDDQPLGPADVRSVAGLEQVAAADGVLKLYAQVDAGAEQDAAVIAPVASHEALEVFDPAEGRLPERDGEVALTTSTAERLGAAVGDVVRVEHQQFVEASPGSPEDGGTWEAVSDELSVTGLVKDPQAILGSSSTVLVTRDVADAWASAEAADGELRYDQVLVAGAGGTGGAAVADEEVAKSVRAALPQADVRTALEEAEAKTAELTGQAQTLTYFVLAFAAVAMFVAALVIANTFQVLVAQRARTLALLRCVGATKAQVHRSVLLEATVLGVVASTAGLLLGLALGQGALWFLQGADLGVDVAGTVPLTAPLLAVPLLTGTAVTVLAALAPARTATRVAPLSALRPAPDPASRAGGGRVRRWAAVGLGTVGALLLGGASAAILVREDSGNLMGLALLVGIAGGILSFAGVMVGAVFVVPRAVSAAGAALSALAGRHRATVRLATVNSTRNPRRTSATASALVIGVALVVMMATGAATARTSLDRALAETFPVDVMVQGEQVTPAHLDAVRGADGVYVAAPVTSATVQLGSGASTTEVNLLGIDPARAAEVVRDPALFAELDDDVLLLGDKVAETAALESGQDVTVTTSGSEVTRTVVVVPAGTLAVASAVTLEQLSPGAPVVAVWARLADDVPAAETVRDVQDAVVEASDDVVPYVTGLAAERQIYADVIDTLLAIVIGLLGVAVLIALVGVANTLSLSVIERRHEHALLRAVGLTRSQLRGTLVVEGVLIALVGTVLGVVLGMLYGWAGSVVLLGATGDVTLAVPWLHLGAVAVVALVAGLAASVLPARSAVRTPPVAALAA
ncbi:FtsX-like permease family protein [Georgenia muralis]